MQPTGGLVGRATAVNIGGSFSTGAVLGDGILGGLAGMFMGGGPRGDYVATISSSWTTSTVTLTAPVTRDTFVGGLIGQAGLANIGSSVFYNGGTAGGAALGAPSITARD
jgi:hypothetical protein